MPTNAQTTITTQYTMKSTSKIDNESRIPFMFLLKSFEYEIKAMALTDLANRNVTKGSADAY